MGKTLELYIENKEYGKLWAAKCNNLESSKHVNVIDAIINSGYCCDKETASLMWNKINK